LQPCSQESEIDVGMAIFATLSRHSQDQIFLPDPFPRVKIFVIGLYEQGNT